MQKFLPNFKCVKYPVKLPARKLLVIYHVWLRYANFIYLRTIEKHDLFILQSHCPGNISLSLSLSMPVPLSLALFRLPLSLFFILPFRLFSISNLLWEFQLSLNLFYLFLILFCICFFFLLVAKIFQMLRILLTTATKLKR